MVWVLRQDNFCILCTPTIVMFFHKSVWCVLVLWPLFSPIVKIKFPPCVRWVFLEVKSLVSTLFFDLRRSNKVCEQSSWKFRQYKRVCVLLFWKLKEKQCFLQKQETKRANAHTYRLLVVVVVAERDRNKIKENYQ